MAREPMAWHPATLQDSRVLSTQVAVTSSLVALPTQRVLCQFLHIECIYITHRNALGGGEALQITTAAAFFVAPKLGKEGGNKALQHATCNAVASFFERYKGQLNWSR